MPAMQETTRKSPDHTRDDITLLQGLLARKLKHIPNHVLPALTINDILFQTARAVNIPNIPPDLQLPFLFRQRTYIDRHGGRPIKDANEQSLDITRACFFYHLNDTHPFQRYHDTSRWNLSLFTALLTSHHNPTHPSRTSHTSIPRGPLTFMKRYLAAVLEHHNHPLTFTCRESFIRLWKRSKYTLFHDFGAAQKKRLKREQRRLTGKWEALLDRTMRQMGSDDYFRRVAPFVACLVPGSRDQDAALCERVCASGVVGTLLGDGMGLGERRVDDGNMLLEALKVPLLEPRVRDALFVEEEEEPLVDLRYAIRCLQSVEPEDILVVLLRLFPMGEEGRGMVVE